MKTLMMVHGMKRSGNHAIINWINAHGQYIFINNVIHIAPILLGQKTMPPPEDFLTWLHRRCPRRTLIGKLRMPSLLHRFFLHRKPVIASLEDHDIQVRPFRNIPSEVTNILILRDPVNLFASRIRKASLTDNPAYLTTDPAMKRVLDNWKSHAREYLGMTSYLENKVCVYFNSWFSDQTYRQLISNKLNITFTDEGFRDVSQRGGGSSFDSTQFDGNNRKMNVLDRQSHLSDSEKQILQNVLEDKELQDLDEKVRNIESAQQDINKIKA